MTDMADGRRGELLRGALSGDPVAVSHAILEGLPGLWGHISAMVPAGRRAGAMAAVVRETVRHTPPDLSDPAELEAWIYAVARWVLLRSHIPAQVHAEQLVGAPTSPAVPPSHPDLSQEVCEVLNWLDPADRGIIDITFARNMSGRPLDHILGISGAGDERQRLDSFLDRANSMVGALVLLRQSNPACPEMVRLRARYLTDKGVRAGHRRAVCEHVDECGICGPLRAVLLGGTGRLGALSRVSHRTPPPPDPDEIARELASPSARRQRRRAGPGRRRWPHGWPPCPGLPRWSLDGLWGDRRRFRVPLGLPRQRKLLALAIGIGALVIGGSVAGVMLTGDGDRVDVAAAGGSRPGGQPGPTQPGPTQPGPAQPGPALPAGRLTVGVTRLDYGSSGVRRTIPIHNAGVGPVSFEVTGGPSWLATAPRVGTLQAGSGGAVEVELLRAAAPPRPGTVLHVRAHHGTGTGGGDVTVTGEVGPEPIGQLQVRTEAIDFGAHAVYGQIDVANVGDAPIDYALTDPPGWLRVAGTGRSSGRLAPDAHRIIEVALDRDQLPLGPFAGRVQVRASGGPGGREVRLSGRRDPERHPTGVLAVLTDVLDLGSDGTAGDIVVRNTGDAPVDYAADAVPRGLTLHGAPGTLQLGERRALRVTVTRASLPEGTFLETVRIGARHGDGGGSTTVTARVHHPTGVLSVLTRTVDLGTTGADGTARGTIEITNTGDAPAGYRLTHEPSWLTSTAATGTIPANPVAPVRIPITLTRTTLKDGPVSGSVDVEATRGGRGGGHVTVSGTIHTPVGKLEVVTTNVTFGTCSCATVTRTIAVRNTGDAPVSYALVSAPSWLTSTASTGTIPAATAGRDTTVDIPVTLTRAGLRDGPLDGSVRVEATDGGSGGGTVALAATIRTPVGHLVVRTPTLAFGDRGTTGTITLENTGDAPVHVTTTGIPAWLNLKGSSGTLGPAGSATAIAHLPATLHRSAIQGRAVTATITFTAPAGQGGGTVAVSAVSYDIGTPGGDGGCRDQSLASSHAVGPTPCGSLRTTPPTDTSPTPRLQVTSATPVMVLPSTPAPVTIR